MRHQRTDRLLVPRRLHLPAQIAQSFQLLFQSGQELLGEERVRDIRFRVGAGGVLHEQEEEGIELGEIILSAAEREEIAHLVSDVEDGRLREALRAFFITERRIAHLRERRGFKRCPRCSVLHRGEGELCPYCQLESGQDTL